MRIKVKATAAVAGLRRGDVTTVTVTPFVETLLGAGFLLWMDPPEPTVEEYQITTTVANRIANSVTEQEDFWQGIADEAEMWESD